MKSLSAMVMDITSHIVLSMSLIGLTACGPVKLENCQKLKTNDPRIIEFANKCATKSGMDLSLYDPPIIHEWPDIWMINYEGKKKTFGNSFGIGINRTNCGCDIVGGQ